MPLSAAEINARYAALSRIADRVASLDAACSTVEKADVIREAVQGCASSLFGVSYPHGFADELCDSYPVEVLVFALRGRRCLTCSDPHPDPLAAERLLCPRCYRRYVVDRQPMRAPRSNTR